MAGVLHNEPRKIYMIYVHKAKNRNQVLEQKKLEKKGRKTLRSFGKLLYPVFIIAAYGEPEDPNQLLKQRELDKTAKKKSLYSLEEEELECVRKWYYSFKEERLKELFERYYVEGYHRFCLAAKPEIEEDVPSYRFLLCEYLIQDLPHELITKESANSLADDYFGKWIDLIRSDYGNNYMSKAKFLTFIRKVREIAEIYEENKTIKYDECKKLNQLCKQLPKDRDITSDFLQSILNSLTEDLLQNKVILQCEFCGDFFRHIREKKYCSFKSEGKNCGKSARNKRYYEKHKDEILPKARKSTKELRAFYKKKGVKK